jgi:hypothetical protein
MIKLEIALLGTFQRPNTTFINQSKALSTVAATDARNLSAIDELSFILAMWAVYLHKEVIQESVQFKSKVVLYA